MYIHPLIPALSNAYMREQYQRTCALGPEPPLELMFSLRTSAKQHHPGKSGYTREGRKSHEVHLTGIVKIHMAENHV
jgi:hypothetical protein